MKRNRWRKRETSNLFGTAFKHHILLTLVQPPLPHGPEVKNSILPLQQLVQDIYKITHEHSSAWCNTPAPLGYVPEVLLNLRAARFWRNCNTCLTLYLCHYWINQRFWTNLFSEWFNDKYILTIYASMDIDIIILTLIQ